MIATIPVNQTTGIQLVAYAYNFIGTPYVYGGKSPIPGFDNSGFMQYVYAHYGFEIGGDIYSQITNGYEVSRNQLQLGDLVFFGDKSAPVHVGMYVGNGMFIHASHPGDFVKFSELAGRSDLCEARRICNE